MIQVIEASMIPIICICNDRDSKKIQSLARKCYDCSFGKLPKEAMVTRLQFICKKEEIAMSKSDLEELVESSGGDMRQVACFCVALNPSCLNKLQYYKLEIPSSLNDTLPSLRADTVLFVTSILFLIVGKPHSVPSRSKTSDRRVQILVPRTLFPFLQRLLAHTSHYRRLLSAVDHQQALQGRKDARGDGGRG